MITGVDYVPLKSDIWSSGVTLYVMLCGKMPFQDETIDSLYRTILEKDINYPDFLSDDAVDFLKNLLKKNPDERFGFEEAFEHEWVVKNKPENFDFLVSVQPREKIISVKILIFYFFRKLKKKKFLVRFLNFIKKM